MTWWIVFSLFPVILSINHVGTVWRPGEPIGRSIKCQHCREVFGWLDLDLLAVSDSEIPNKQACTPCKDEGTLVQAEFYCVTCQTPVCQECNKFHNRFFKSKLHQVVTFNEYRLKSDQMTKKCCTASGHDGSEINSLCVKCQRVLCTKCFTIGCGKQGEHLVTSIETEAEKLTGDLNAEIAALQERISKNESSIKQTQDEMETLRVKSEELKMKISEHFEAKMKNIAEILEKKRIEFLEIVDHHLQKSADKVNEYLESAKGLVTRLQSLEEGLSSVVQFTHPTHLLQIQEEVRENIAKVREYQAKPPLPYYIPFQTDSNISGIEISFPPYAITYLRTISTANNSCYTVEFDENDHLLRGGNKYISDNIRDAPQYVPSLRKTKDHVVLLHIDPSNRNRTTLEVYQHVSNYPEKDKSFNRVLHAKSEAEHDNFIHRIAMTQSHIFQCFGSLFIYNRQDGQLLKKVDEIKKARGACADENEENLYVNDHESLYVYNIADGTIRTLCKGLPSPRVPRLHRGLIYVLCEKETDLKSVAVINTKGELLQTLVLPETWEKRMDDFAISSQGLVAVANLGKGIQMYQLEYPNT